MMRQKGRPMWVPPVVIDELEDVKREDGLESSAEAFKHLVKHARIGREVNRMKRFDWSKAKELQPINAYVAITGAGKNGKKWRMR